MILDDLKWRGLIYQTTSEELLKQLDTDKISFYMGVDPTADSMHIGGLAALMFTKRLAMAGHKPTILLGGMTGMIGDPSGRTTERTLLSLEKINENVQALKKQISGICGDNYNYVNNIDWLDMPLSIFLRDFGKQFNINHMLAKDIVSSRLETGISFTEFSYQILQSVDFEKLFKDKGIIMQCGGQDQWGNITGGLDLIRKNHGTESKAFGLTFPLLMKSDGTKFGKSQAGNVWLDVNKTSEYTFYQFLFNQNDADVLNLIKVLTFVSKEKFAQLEVAVKENPARREAQTYLAEEVTRIVHGDKGLEKAKQVTAALFSGDIKNLSAAELKASLDGVPSANITEGMDILDVMVATTCAKSRREARDFVTAGSIMLNGEKIQDENIKVNKNDAFNNEFIVIKRGKRNYYVANII